MSEKIFKIIPPDTITFPELRMLKGKYSLSNDDLAHITGDTDKTFWNKLTLRSEFSLTDMFKIVKFFRSKGDNVSIQQLFFDWIFSIEKIA
jgi:hypothetical protein